jgi:ABC-2 type transport system permease protein
VGDRDAGRVRTAGRRRALALRAQLGVAALAKALLRELWRQPWFVAVTLVQPVIWLLLFGALFKRVIEIPGFHGHSYIAFLAPGVVVMTALFSSAWSGMALIDDINRGVTARFLVSPVRREALIAGRILKEAVVVVIQSLIIVALALIVGASFPGGVAGVAVLLVVSALLGATFGALSNGFGLIMRQEEALIGAVQFIVLPLTFLSATFLAANLIPKWMQHVADFNPVNWAVVAGRSAISANPDWGVVAARAGFLVALLALSVAFATRAFQSYQRSV